MKLAGPDQPTAAHESMELPSDQSSERALLSCVVQSPSKSIALVEDSGGSDLFHDLRTRTIYRACVKIHKEAKNVDIVALQRVLQSEDSLGLCGGVVKLVELLDLVPSAANVSYYLARVVECRLRRRAIEAAWQVSESAVSGDMEALWGSCAELGKVHTEAFKGRRESVQESLEAIVGEIETAMRTQGALIGVSSGIEGLDEMTMGFRESDLIILAARPSVGKTTMVMNMAEALLFGREPKAVGVFSLEMDQKSLLMRMMCSRSRVRLSDIHRGSLTEAESARVVKALGEIKQSPVVVDDTPAITVEQFHAKARAMKESHGVEMLVVDYLQLMRSDRVRADNRNVLMTEISNGLKAVAKDLRVPVLALSQLNREIDKQQGRKPRLSDLRDSGAIEQDADVIMFLHPVESGDDVYGDRRQVELILAKQRNGAIGSIPMTFHKAQTRFEEVSQDDLQNDERDF